MNDQSLKLLEKLANKLGVTAEYLWSVLQKQAPIDAVTTLSGIIVCIALVIVGFKVAFVFDSKSVSKEDTYSTLSWVVAFVSIVLSIFTVASIFVTYSSIISGLFNPEYWVLQQILKHV